ncbi:MAG: adenylate kinase [Chloroflexi bacterium]|nr:adenylate kinase [Chloroflexota bacterium]
MQRIVVLGPGAAGKSTFARALSARSGIPLIELDGIFWSPGLEPTPPPRWPEVQRGLADADRWIMDGHLGPYDLLEPRLARAEAAVLFDLPIWRCAWRAVRRSRERSDFWMCLLAWRRRYRPEIDRAIARHPGLRVLVVRTASDAARARSELLAE